ncbi:MAG: hypothetical protein N2202_07355 [Proteobacteria bacterium]|nr:hypothetical protein [Pseudomonadota bacterium]
MFYVYFLILVIVIFFVFWVGFWLYKIMHIKHNAQEILGKLIRLCDKRHDCIKEFINRRLLETENLSEKISEILILIKSSKASKDIYKKLSIEHEITENIKKFDFLSDLQENVLNINEEIHKLAEKYNQSVIRLRELSDKTLVQPIFKIFKIEFLNKIEV